MKNMKVQAKLEIGNNHAKMFSKNYNVVNLFCHYSRQANSTRPDTDARCECIDITLVAPTMDDLSLYSWNISGESLCGRVKFDLTGDKDSDNNRQMLIRVKLFVRSITYKGILRNEILEINK